MGEQRGERLPDIEVLKVDIHFCAKRRQIVVIKEAEFTFPFDPG